jgi:DNA-binding NarL/FixJ family response regulator
MVEERRIRVLVADEQSLFRGAMRNVLEAEEDLQVVAEAGNGFQAVAEAERTSPNVVLLSEQITNFDWPKTTVLLRQRVPSSHVLILGQTEDGETLVDAMEVGAAGYVTKGTSLAEVLDGIRAVYRDGILISPRLLPFLIGGLLRRRQGHDDANAPLATLTKRERQVLPLLARGADNSAIARTLAISPETARTHVQNILKKLRLHSRLEAAALARRVGLLDESTDYRAVNG